MWLALLLSGCAYEAPLSDRFADTTPANVITGTVETDALGDAPNAVVFVSDADSPMPPDGLGVPETFSTVSADDFALIDDGAGVYAAPFSVTSVPDGRWAVTGMLDNDGDFSAVDSILASWSCGDQIGAARRDGALSAVPLSGGELREGTTVTINEQITYERPAFTLEESSLDGSPDNGVDVTIAYEREGALLPQAFSIRATPIHATHNNGGLPLDLDHTGRADAPCEAGFEVILVDADGDGVIDTSSLSDQLFEAWPQILLTYMGEPQEDGTFDTSGVEKGVSWAGLAVLHPFALPAHPEGLFNDPFYVDELSIVWAPGAQKINADGTAEIILDLDQIPRGAWDITVVNPSGSFWYIPNTLSTPDWTIRSDQAWDPSRQGEYLMVTD